MDVAALVAWVLTALGGFVLLGIWLTRRSEPGMRPSRIGPKLLFSHFLVAAAGLVLWLVYVLGVDNALIRWLALAILVVVAGLGVTMSARWFADRRNATPPPTPEQRFPLVVVLGHGLLGAVTLVLVALVAFGGGDG